MAPIKVQIIPSTFITFLAGEEKKITWLSLFPETTLTSICVWILILKACLIYKFYKLINSLLHVHFNFSNRLCWGFFSLSSLWPTKWFMAAEDNVELGIKTFLSLNWIHVSYFYCFSNINSVISESIIISLAACRPAWPECSMRTRRTRAGKLQMRHVSTALKWSVKELQWK